MLNKKEESLNIRFSVLLFVLVLYISSLILFSLGMYLEEIDMVSLLWGIN